MDSPTKEPVFSRIDALLVSLDLGRERTPDELLVLFDKIRPAFKESQELRKKSPPSHPLRKKYIDEVLPLTHLVQHLFPDDRDVLCQPNLKDSENYDAIINCSGGTNPTRLFVEFTCAIDGRNESLRMKVLNDKGRVNSFGEVKYSGTKNRGHHIEVYDEFVARPYILEKQRRLIIDRIKAKAKKKYSLEHILVVVFDDYVGFSSNSEIAYLKSSIASAIDLPALKFRSLFLLGRSGKTFSELSILS
jgi:hypothetical protein